MSEVRERKLGFKLRVGLLVLQILLPFGLYLSMNAGNRHLVIVIAGMFGLSMLALVVLT